MESNNKKKKDFLHSSRYPLQKYSERIIVKVSVFTFTFYSHSVNKVDQHKTEFTADVKVNKRFS